MKSDLVGKVNVDEIKVSTLYIDRRAGIVVLTTDTNPLTGMVVHSVNNKNLPIGTLVSLSNGSTGKSEVLGGKIELSNF